MEWLDSLRDARAVAKIAQRLQRVAEGNFGASAIGDVARSRNLSTIARNAGLSRETIYQAFSPEGNPTLSTVTAVMKSLGFQLSVKPIETAAG